MLETASEIARHHRVPGSPGYAAAADVILGRLADAGVAAVVHEYPADGEAKTYDWTAPLAWSVRSGTLAEASPSARLIVDFDEIAQGVVVHSPGGTFEGDLVHVGAPARDAAYDAFDLAGKVALVCASASDGVLRAARRGAVGVVVYPNDERSAASHDLVQYHSLFPRAADVPHLVPAFSVSRRTADRWVRQLASGAVILRGAVDAEFHPGTLKVVEATVPGTASGAASVLFSAHLCHPRGSANDNASGAAVVAELARVVALSPLRAGARFLWMAEFYGSLPWAAAHAPELATTEFALNLDMVGSSPEKVGEPLRIFRAANHTPHYVNALVEPLATLVAVDRGSVSAHGSVRPLHWSFDLPSGGSDHLTFEAAPHGRPALMFGHDDPYWHTDLDTVDRIDPTRMKHVAILAAGLAQAGAPDASEVEQIWGDLLVHAAGELARAADIGRTLESGLAGRLVDLSLGVEIERARTLRSVGSRKQTKRVALLRAIRGELSTSRDVAASGPQPDEPRPTRQVDGPLAYAVTERFTDEEREFFKDRFGANHRALAAGLLNHCDGTKTPSDIALLLSLDAGRAVDIDDVRRGIELLRKTGYVA
jgi:hypothetical protein